MLIRYSPKHTHPSEYYSFMAAKGRCTNPRNKSYHNYGGRGIKFSFSSFQEFYECLGPKPVSSKRYTLERIDNNGHYEIGNVKWLPLTQQQRNRRNNVRITVDGETRHMTDWHLVYGVSISVISKRIHRDGWCSYCAVTIPPNKTRTTSKIKKCTHLNQS